MKETMKTILLPIIVLILSNCTTTANLYPIEGPLSKTKPLPVLVAHIDGIMGNSGNITMTMPDGEKMSGKWSSVAPQQVSISTMNLFNTYGSSIYGSGISSSNVGGVNKGMAFLHGNNDTTIDVEFLTGSGTASGHGIAKDSNNNVYKVLF